MRTEKMVRVSSKGQIVLPKRLRERRGIREGDYLIVDELDTGDLIIRKSGMDRLDEITEGLRREIEARGITPEQLDEWIDEVRGELRTDGG